MFSLTQKREGERGGGARGKGQRGMISVASKGGQMLEKRWTSVGEQSESDQGVKKAADKVSKNTESIIVMMPAPVQVSSYPRQRADCIISLYILSKHSAPCLKTQTNLQHS